MGVKVGDALPLSSEPVEYQYDFGSTTTLKLSVMTERTGRPWRSAVRLLARNTPACLAVRDLRATRDLGVRVTSS